jgi:UDP-N-acetylglucosamine--N-acetylmuramyl-(pentapeptide) pyrophosphoryl-undecaprenol N-acetylglucosamine transferase
MAARSEGMITAKLDAGVEPRSGFADRTPSQAEPRSGEASSAGTKVALPSAASRPILIAAGGTGGHVLPALQVARELSRRGRSCFFVGTERGQERRLVPEAGFALEFLQTGALKNVSAARRLRTLLQGPASLFAANSILEQTRPAAMMSLGGYAAGPLLVMAVMRGVPVLILEPNALPGLAHRWAGPFVSWALVGFPAAERYFPSGRVEIGGIPIREEFFALPRKERAGPFVILITGGSQGAKQLNEAAIRALPLWKKAGTLKRLRFVHQTGAADYEHVQAAYESEGAEAVVAPFFSDMPALFAEADLIVCRAGASAVAELAAAGKASILVPYPFAADQHQLRNAESMVEAGAARLVVDREWSGERFVKEIAILLKSNAILATMEDSARRQARPGAAQRAADVLERLVDRGRILAEGAKTKLH